MKVLYLLSNFLYVLLYHVIGYRKKVVYHNLKLSFPEWSEAKIHKTSKAFYSHLADLIVESVKSFSISEEEILQRATVTNDFITREFGENKSVILLLGHIGNWEWVGLGASAFLPFKIHIVYHQLSNPDFDKLMYNTRSRFGAYLSRMEDTLRSMVKQRSEIVATCLVADQNPSPENAYWIDFLNRKTAFFRGPFKLAHKFKQPCYYASIKKVSRGKYHSELVLLGDKDQELTEDELMHRYVELLEKDIREHPEFWLWSHRRWKHKYEDYAEKTV
jgi:Kdo2-lipid IVA lauroyltransferase/acyltransferase